MTRRNGTGGTSDRRLDAEANQTFRASDEMDGVRASDDRDCEEGERQEGGSKDDTPAPTMATHAAPDGGWGWVVLVATILVAALTLAFPSCVGIFYTDLQNDFHASNSQTSWVPSIMTSVLHAGGPLCSVLVERFGCRATVMLGGVLSGLGMAASSFTNSIMELYVTAGVITGLGFCFSFQPAVTILGHYFVRRRAFANAMSSTGTALGLCLLPFLGNFLHEAFGWRGSFLVLGGVLLNCCVCGAVMRPVRPPERRGRPLMDRGPPPPDGPPRGKGASGPRAAWRRLLVSVGKHMAFDQLSGNRRYRAYAVGVTWMMLGFVVPLVYLVPYATAHGMEQGRAALLLSILGVVNIAVRPGFAVLFNLPWFKGRHVYVFAAALLVNGLSNVVCSAGPGFAVLLVYVAVYGLSMSVVGSLMFTVLMDIVEMSRFPSALGLLAVMESVTLLVGPPLAGLLVDRTGHYFHVFFACSAVVSSAALFLLLSFYYLDRKRQAAHSQHGVAPTLPPTPGQAAACRYSSVPTEGDRDKALAYGAEGITSL